MMVRFGVRNMLVPRLLAAFAVAAALTPATMGQIIGGFGSSQRPGQPQDTTRYKVTGTVVNAVTGGPISRALVQVNGAGITNSQNAMLTDGLGHFEFEVAGSSMVMMFPRKPGFFSEQELSQGPRSIRSAMFQVGPNLEPIVLKLTPEATIIGRIVGSEGEPLEFANVRLMTSQIVQGRKHWQQSGGASTDDDGRFRIGGIRPGSYLIMVGTTRSGFLETALPVKGPAMGYPLEWFYPGVPERSAAGVIELAPGATFQHDFTLRKQPVYKVSGTLLRPDGIQGMGSGVGLTSLTGEPLPAMSMMGQDGGFEIRNVPAGTYFLQSNGGDSQGHQYFGQTQVSVNSDVKNAVVVLSSPPSIPVVIKTEFNKPQAEPGPFHGSFCNTVNGNTTCSTTPPPGFRQAQAIQVQLRNLDPPYNSAFSQAEPGDTASIAIRNVRAGRYAVEFSQNLQHYVKSAMCGNIDLLREPLNVSANAQIPPINVTLRDDVGSLTITPNGEIPDAGAQVLIFPDGESTQVPRLTFLTPPPPPGNAPSGVPGNIILRAMGMGPGAAQVPGLPPGDYSVLAFDHLDNLEYANPDVMKKYMTRASHATVNPDGKTTVSVEIIRVEQ